MPCKKNSHQIERFPLMPIGGTPNSRNRGDLRQIVESAVILDLHFQHKLCLIRDRSQVIHDGKPIIGMIIYRGYIRKKVKITPFSIPQKEGNFYQIVGIYNQNGL